jgi:hypothetical protein
MSTLLTASAVRTGTVDFSTTTLLLVAISAILRAHSSQFCCTQAKQVRKFVDVQAVSVTNTGEFVQSVYSTVRDCDAQIDTQEELDLQVP